MGGPPGPTEDGGWPRGPPHSCPCSSPGALGLSGLGAEVAKPPTRRTLPSLSLGIPGSAGPRARHRSFPSESSEAGQVAERPLCQPCAERVTCPREFSRRGREQAHFKDENTETQAA